LDGPGESQAESEHNETYPPSGDEDFWAQSIVDAQVNNLEGRPIPATNIPSCFSTMAKRSMTARVANGHEI